jgi:hypothetical protein
LTLDACIFAYFSFKYIILLLLSRLTEQHNNLTSSSLASHVTQLIKQAAICIHVVNFIISEVLRLFVSRIREPVNVYTVEIRTL